jgi:hypothetical protein
MASPHLLALVSNCLLHQEVTNHLAGSRDTLVEASK